MPDAPFDTLPRLPSRPAPSRPLTIHCPAIPQLFGKDVLEPLKLSGYEGINSMFEYRLILQTSEAAKHTGLQGNLLQLNRFTGHEICCAIELDGHGSFVPGMPGSSGLANRGAGTRYIGGFIESTIFHGEDNHQALFEFVLRPWLHVACLRSDRRIYQNITAVDAIRAILSRYPYACEYRLSGEYPVRDYIVQYAETDHQFTTRLMQDCGINYHFEHRANGHCLVLSDHPGAFTPLQASDPESAYHRIPYYPPGHKIDREYLYAFTPVASMTSDQTATRDFDYTQPNATIAGQGRDAGAGSAAGHEVYFAGNRGPLPGVAAPQPNAGADPKAAARSARQAQNMAQMRMQLLRQNAQRAHGSGHVRGIAPGHTFTLENYPWRAGNVEYLALRTHFCIENVSQESQRSGSGSGSGASSNASPLSAIIPTRRADLHFVSDSRIPAPPENAYTGTNAPANASAQPPSALHLGNDTRSPFTPLSSELGAYGPFYDPVAEGGSAQSIRPRGLPVHPLHRPLGPNGPRNPTGGVPVRNPVPMTGVPIYAPYMKTPKPAQVMSQAQYLSGQWRVLCHFEAQPSTTVLRPARTHHKPRAMGPEMAVVCAPEGKTAESNMYTDAYGRIKVRFPWDRYATKDHRNSCWVRIAAEWAGNEQGSIHLPRAGQEVLIEFMADDPERPISTGCFYNAKNPPPWKLPDQQALSGWRSRELSPGLGNAFMGRSNHVLLDDTPGAMQVQAKSDHLHSSASAGAIYRIEDNKGRKEFRGEGVEVRTDGPGVVRGQAGLLATTEGRPEAQGHITDVSETAQRLHEAQQQQDQHALLAQQAGTQDAADQAEVAKALLAQAHEIGGTAGVTGNGAAGSGNAAADSTNTADSNALPKPFPEFSAPHIVLASAAGIATTATQSTHEHSAMHHAITAAKHISLSVGNSLLASVDGAIRFLAYHAGLRIMSVTGKMEVAALDKTIRVTSALKIKQVGDTVHIEADEGVEINGGGSYSHFRDGVVEEGTAGEYVVHSNGTGTDGAQSLAVTPQVFPQYTPKACGLQFHAHDAVTGKTLAEHNYQIETESLQITKGTTDAEGLTPHVDTPHSQLARIWVAEFPKHMAEIENQKLHV